MPRSYLWQGVYHKLLDGCNCDFDIILGMDWLSRVHTVIDCQKKSVIFQILNQLEFEFPREGRIVDQVAHLNIVPDGTLAILNMD